MTREEAIKELQYLEQESWFDKEAEALKMGIEALENQKIGRWIGHREHCENLGVMPSGLGVYEWCSNCDCGIDIKEWHRTKYNYCPSCGAKMEKE